MYIGVYIPHWENENLESLAKSRNVSEPIDTFLKTTLHQLTPGISILDGASQPLERSFYVKQPPRFREQREGTSRQEIYNSF